MFITSKYFIQVVWHRSSSNSQLLAAPLRPQAAKTAGPAASGKAKLAGAKTSGKAKARTVLTIRVAAHGPLLIAAPASLGVHAHQADSTSEGAVCLTRSHAGASVPRCRCVGSSTGTPRCLKHMTSAIRTAGARSQAWPQGDRHRGGLGRRGCGGSGQGERGGRRQGPGVEAQRQGQGGQTGGSPRPCQAGR